ncbi:MAG: hypothetical protein ACRED3_02565, partial [Bradyrhizobium sp.]
IKRLAENCKTFYCGNSRSSLGKLNIAMACFFLLVCALDAELHHFLILMPGDGPSRLAELARQGRPRRSGLCFAKTQSSARELWRLDR